MCYCNKPHLVDADDVACLIAERDSLKLQVSEAKLRAEVESSRKMSALNFDRGMVLERERDAALLQVDELRKALSQLVKDVEDTWRHGGRCLIGTDEQKPETECECGTDIIDEPLEILARIRPSTENRICDCGGDQLPIPAHRAGCAAKRIGDV